MEYDQVTTLSDQTPLNSGGPFVFPFSTCSSYDCSGTPYDLTVTSFVPGQVSPRSIVRLEARRTLGWG